MLVHELIKKLEQEHPYNEVVIDAENFKGDDRISLSDVCAAEDETVLS